MINFILYLDNEGFWERDEKKLRIQQALEQKSWELRKLYHLPESGKEGEVPDFYVFEEKLPVGRHEEEAWEETIKNISIQIGNNKEWRLLLFLASEKDPLGSEYDYLKMFLAQIMYYDNGNMNGGSGLTCELPEQIWMITLKDTSMEDDASMGLQYYDRAVYGDERGYAGYPPNCRFLCYGIDYRKENYFGREMLKMHCALRCLARPLLSADLLKGNQRYLFGAEWDEEKLCSEIGRYERWLQQVKRKIANIRQSTVGAGMDDYAVIKPPVLATRLKITKIDGKKPIEIRRETESLIEDANIEQRRVLERYREELDENLKKQEGRILLKSRESRLKEDMQEKEKSMYERTDKTSVNRNFGYMMMKIIFRVKNYFVFKDKKSRSERKLEIEKEISYYDKQMRGMKRRAVPRILEALVYINLCFLITWLAGVDIGEDSNVSISGILIGMALTSICVVIVFALFLAGYYFWHRNLCHVFYIIQKEKIISNENYFRNMLDYFRLRRILNFHMKQKKKKSMQEKMYDQWEQEWEKYDEICSQFKISFGKMRHIAVQPGTGRGNIRKMLLKGQYKELYSLYGNPVEITINGDRVVVPFAFIKEIRLVKIYHSP